MALLKLLKYVNIKKCLRKQIKKFNNLKNNNYIGNNLYTKHNTF